MWNAILPFLANQVCKYPFTNHRVMYGKKMNTSELCRFNKQMPLVLAAFLFL